MRLTFSREKPKEESKRNERTFAQVAGAVAGVFALSLFPGTADAERGRPMCNAQIQEGSAESASSFEDPRRLKGFRVHLPLFLENRHLVVSFDERFNRAAKKASNAVRIYSIQTTLEMALLRLGSRKRTKFSCAPLVSPPPVAPPEKVAKTTPPTPPTTKEPAKPSSPKTKRNIPRIIVKSSQPEAQPKIKISPKVASVTLPPPSSKTTEFTITIPPSPFVPPTAKKTAKTSSSPPSKTSKTKSTETKTPKTLKIAKASPTKPSTSKTSPPSKTSPVPEDPLGGVSGMEELEGIDPAYASGYVGANATKEKKALREWPLGHLKLLAKLRLKKLQDLCNELERVDTNKSRIKSCKTEVEETREKLKSNYGRRRPGVVAYSERLPSLIVTMGFIRPLLESARERAEHLATRPMHAKRAGGKGTKRDPFVIEIPVPALEGEKTAKKLCRAPKLCKTPSSHLRLPDPRRGVDKTHTIYFSLQFVTKTPDPQYPTKVTLIRLLETLKTPMVLDARAFLRRVTNKSQEARAMSIPDLSNVARPLIVGSLADNVIGERLKRYVNVKTENGSSKSTKSKRPRRRHKGRRKTFSLPPRSKR